jgi:hypothetical protein
MKLLFDQKLSPKLVGRLADLFPNSSHVQSNNLVPLLATVRREDRPAGPYTIRASYCFQGVEVLAEPLQIEVHGECPPTANGEGRAPFDGYKGGPNPP